MADVFTSELTFGPWASGIITPTAPGAPYRTIQPASASGTNLLTAPQDYTDAAWGKTGGAITPNATTAPDGSNTASKLIEDGSTGFHSVYQVLLTPDVVRDRCLTFILKQSTRTRARVIFQSGSAANGVLADIDLSTGAYITAPTPFGGTTNSGGSVTLTSNGFYICTVFGTLPLGDVNDFCFVRMLDNTNAQAYTGDGVSGLFLWGAKYESGLSFTGYP